YIYFRHGGAVMAIVGIGFCSDEAAKVERETQWLADARPRENMRNILVKILMFLNVAIFVSSLPVMASNLHMYGFSFTPDLQQFLEGLGQDWSCDDAIGQPSSKAFEICRERQQKLGLGQEAYISGCFFRTSQNRYFTGMYLYAKDGTVHRVLLNFSDGQSHDQVYKSLKVNLGKPNLAGKYNEEAFTHNLIGWNKEDYRVIYD